MLKKYAVTLLKTSAVQVPVGASRQLRRTIAKRHHFDFTPKPGYLYVRSRAISSRTNDNFDEFPAEEIAKGYKTFVGKPAFVNHVNDNHRRARGVIIDAVLHQDRLADGHPDTWAEVLHEIDAQTFPKLAKAIIEGRIDRTSMGCDVEYSLCSACGNKATTPAEYCAHIPRLKGKRISKRNPETGEMESHLIRETCYGLRFFENSLLVEEPADPTAFFTGVQDYSGMGKAASRETASRPAEPHHAAPSLATPGHAEPAHQRTASHDRSTDPLSTSECVSRKDNPTFCLWHKTDHLETDGEPRTDIDGHGKPMSDHVFSPPECDLCDGFHDTLHHYDSEMDNGHKEDESVLDGIPMEGSLLQHFAVHDSEIYGEDEYQRRVNDPKNWQDERGYTGTHPTMIGEGPEAEQWKTLDTRHYPFHPMHNRTMEEHLPPFEDSIDLEDNSGPFTPLKQSLNLLQHFTGIWDRDDPQAVHLETHPGHPDSPTLCNRRGPQYRTHPDPSHATCSECLNEHEGSQPCDEPVCEGWPEGEHTKAEHMDPADRDPYSDQSMDAYKSLKETGLDEHPLAFLLEQNHREDGTNGPSHFSVLMRHFASWDDEDDEDDEGPKDWDSHISVDSHGYSATGNGEPLTPARRWDPEYGDHTQRYRSMDEALHHVLHAHHADGEDSPIWVHGEHGPVYREADYQHEVNPHIEKHMGNFMGEGKYPSGKAPLHPPIDDYSSADDIRQHLREHHGEQIKDSDLHHHVNFGGNRLDELIDGIGRGIPNEEMHAKNPTRPVAVPKDHADLLSLHETLHEPGQCPAGDETCHYPNTHEHAARDTGDLFDPSVFGDEDKRDAVRDLMEDGKGPTKHSMRKSATNTEPIDLMIQHWDKVNLGHGQNNPQQREESLDHLKSLRDEGHTHVQRAGWESGRGYWKPVHPSTGVQPIEDAINGYGHKINEEAARDPEAKAPYDRESMAQIYHPRVKALIDLQNQGFTHARWGRDYDGDEVNKWHGAMPTDGPTKYSKKDEAPETNSEASSRQPSRAMPSPSGTSRAVSGVKTLTTAKKVEAPTHAGLVLKARDSGRILMLQRSFKDEDDPARGCWEFPGGGIEDGDRSSFDAAVREWEEEIGQKFPDGGTLVHAWISSNKVYAGYVVMIPTEDLVTLTDGRVMTNPDDPDGDDAEQAAWWDPKHAMENPALRREVKKAPWDEVRKAAAYLDLPARERKAPRVIDKDTVWPVKVWTNDRATGERNGQFQSKGEGDLALCSRHLTELRRQVMDHNEYNTDHPSTAEVEAGFEPLDGGSCASCVDEGHHTAVQHDEIIRRNLDAIPESDDPGDKTCSTVNPGGCGHSLSKHHVSNGALVCSGCSCSQSIPKYSKKHHHRTHHHHKHRASHPMFIPRRGWLGGWGGMGLFGGNRGYCCPSESCRGVDTLEGASGVADASGDAGDGGDGGGDGGGDA